VSLVSVGAGFLAGILSTLSPCVFPLLPLVIGAATSTQRTGAFWLAGGVAASFTAAGLFVATVGFAIGLDQGTFRTASAILLMVLGAVLLSSALQARLGAAGSGLASAGDRLIRRLALTSGKGQFVVGILLGLVWSPCAGPTLGAASLLAAQRKGLGGVAAVMLAFGVGTTLPILMVALLSRQMLLRWRGRMLSAGHLGKVAMGISAVAVGALILGGVDRRIEAGLVSASPVWLTNLTTRF
jgi:cytochrome c-type biogenesis protein